jgi:hypothetical protein
MAEVPAGTATSSEPVRRLYLLDRGFQLKYAVVMALAGLAVAAVFGLWVHQAHAQATALLSADPETRALLEKGDRMLLAVLGGVALLLAGALGLLGVVITHRVAGPVFVMGHYLAVIAEGRYPRMRTLRSSDELRGFFATFLAAVERLKDRERRHAAVLEDAAHRMRAALPRAPDLEPALLALEAAAAERRLALAADSPELTPVAVPAPKVGAAR